MRKILCATDLSSGADEALRQADALARLAGSSLEVLHVVPSPLRSYPLFPHLHQREASALPGLVERAAVLLGERVRAATGRGPEESSLVVRDGVPYAEVVRRAEEAGADLLVVGAAGATGTRPLGDVAEKVLRNAPCPVLVARPACGAEAVLAATDLSDPSLPAITEGARFALLRSAPLTVLHNVDVVAADVAFGMAVPGLPVVPPDGREGLVSGARAHLLDALVRSGVAAGTIVTTGDPAASILRAAAELPAGLVVLGTHGRTGLARLLLGSVASEVARSATCPVLAVRLRAGDRNGA